MSAVISRASTFVQGHLFCRLFTWEAKELFVFFQRNAQFLFFLLFQKKWLFSFFCFSQSPIALISSLPSDGDEESSAMYEKQAFPMLVVNENTFKWAVLTPPLLPVRARAQWCHECYFNECFAAMSGVAHSMTSWRWLLFFRWWRHAIVLGQLNES